MTVDELIERLKTIPGGSKVEMYTPVSTIFKQVNFVEVAEVEDFTSTRGKQRGERIARLYY